MLKKNILLLILLGFFINPIKIIAQKPADTLIAYEYYEKAVSLLEEDKDYKASIDFFNKALPIYEKSKNWRRVVECYVNIGNNYKFSFDFKNAIHFLEKSYNTTKDKLPSDDKLLATTLLNLGNINGSIGKYEKALSFYEKELDVYLKIYGKTHQTTSDAYANIGLSYRYLGELYKALEYYEKSLNIKTKILDENNVTIGINYINIGTIYSALRQDDKANEFYHKALPYLVANKHYRGIAGTYNNIGEIFRKKGKLNRALNYYQKALTITLDNNHKDISILSLIYKNIGVTYGLLNEFDEGLIYLNKSLEKYKSFLGETHPNIAYIYDNIGAIYTEKGEYDIALKYHKKALEIEKNILGDNIDVAYSYQLIGNIKYNNEAYDEALFYYQKGFEIIKKLYGDNHLLASDFYVNIGLAHYKNKEYNTALEHLEKALIANTKNNSDSNRSYNPNDYYDTQLLLKIVRSKAEVRQSQYIETNSKEYLLKSIQLYEDADKIIDYLRTSFGNYEDKLTLAKEVKTLYKDAISAQLLLYKSDNDQEALSKAWYFSERSKANTLKGFLEDTDAKNFAGIPSEILSLERRIKSDRAYYQSQIVNEQSKDSLEIEKIKGFENELFTINQREDSLLQSIKKDYPKYYNLKHKNELITVSDVQKKINNKTVVLEFFITDSITYAFVVSKNAISVKELPVTGLAEKIKHLNKTITSSSKEYIEVGQSLYQEILFPIKEELIGDELVIIPDGALWHLNFDLLITKKDDNENLQNLSYLLRDYAISYANSANLLFNPVKDTVVASENREECLAFSYSDTTNVIDVKTISLATLRNSKEDLPGTRREIKAISEIIDGQYFYGREASEATFKKNADRYNILHLALHGEVDDEKPENSKLYFTKTKDTIEDGLLYAHELYALNIPADLVVLSACDTGSGKIANGEGLMSLGNSFQYAGAQSLLLSRWEISDVTTPILMKYFYKNLKDGQNKAKALQQAKLKYLNTTEEYSISPVHWGSFYIIGNTEAIPFDNNFNEIYWLIGGGLGIILILFFWRKRKRVKKVD